MAAFEKIHSGLPGLDRALDSIRMGDNVVWQVSSLSEYAFFLEPFTRTAPTFCLVSVPAAGIWRTLLRYMSWRTDRFGWPPMWSAAEPFAAS